MITLIIYKKIGKNKLARSKISAALARRGARAGPRRADPAAPGLQTGDVIVQINGWDVEPRARERGHRSAGDELETLPFGHEVVLAVRRGKSFGAPTFTPRRSSAEL